MTNFKNRTDRVEALRWDGREVTWVSLVDFAGPERVQRRKATYGGIRAYVRINDRWHELRLGYWLMRSDLDGWQIAEHEWFRRHFVEDGDISSFIERWQPPVPPIPLPHIRIETRA